MLTPTLHCFSSDIFEASYEIKGHMAKWSNKSYLGT